MINITQTLVLFMTLLTTNMADSKTIKKGFVIESPLIPVSEMRNGGPPRDGIPSIDNPQYVTFKESEIKTGKAMLVEYKGLKRLYPLKILDLHEIVNDKFKDQRVAVTYCPLCGSGVVFNAQVGFKKLTFGVSGLLYQSDVLLYDRETESLWSQLMRKSVNGPLKGKILEVIPSSIVNLEDFSKDKEVSVLSTKTGYERDYTREAYAGYEDKEALMFPVLHEDKGAPNKTWSVLIERGEERTLVPMTAFSNDKGLAEVMVGDHKIKVEYNQTKGTIYCREQDTVLCFSGYYFALRAFYPEARLYDPSH